MARISIIGTGTWGIALAILLHRNGHQITAWSKFPEEIQALDTTRVHPNLKGAQIPAEIVFTSDLQQACTDQDMLVLAVPSVFTRETAAVMCPYVAEGQIIVNVSKGIEESTLKILTEQIEEEIPQAQTAVLSGPSHAEEVSVGMPTICVAGAWKKEVAELVQEYFMSPVFRVYTSPDMLGIEIGGALKNVIALAAGVADGLGCGDNTKAALITRGITELSRLGVKMGGRAETFSGLTCTGDLIVTCASVHSRNRNAGVLIGQGYTMEEAMKEVNMVVEGVYSAKAALALSKKYEVSMPIVEAVNKVLFEGQPAREALTELMVRVKTNEVPWEE